MRLISSLCRFDYSLPYFYHTFAILELELLSIGLLSVDVNTIGYFLVWN